MMACNIAAPSFISDNQFKATFLMLRHCFSRSGLLLFLFLLTNGITVSTGQAQQAPLPAKGNAANNASYATTSNSDDLYQLPDKNPAPNTPIAKEAQPFSPDSPYQSYQPSSTPLSQDNASPLLRSQFNSQRLPKGTRLKIRFQSVMDSDITQTGEPFTAILEEDLMAPGAKLILPKGTVLRGRVTQARDARFFSKGGEIAITFDHVVLSNGLQQPIDLNLSLANAQVSRQGSFYSDPGYGNKVKAHFDQGSDLMSSITRAGRDLGDSWGAGGIGKIVTVPVAGAGGVVAGTGLFAGKSVYSAIAPGQEVLIRPDDIVLVELAEDTTFPSET